ncbi:DUF3606 domain-containing protein [Edaphobacter dinghuensis]|uniref:DUF3606 domain-containing protein n=1 Tax=Edaphobacter dinghuensis TaxID=1560005 RepID=A0A917H9G5_9BACT|nr:DUF3606 domain-containing protein [Edaphobacter dinghuensis]GGG71908.1 hypothetical protein GCM10011585_12740 [Edaphobacter dinghuensis]
MSDDLTKRGIQDKVRINVNEPWEVEQWCKKFKVTPARLRGAVKAVGVSVKKVEAYLKERWS